MGYDFNYETGEYSTEKKSNVLNTEDGFIPYYNLDKQYVGFKHTETLIDLGLQYFNPTLNIHVDTYEELNWQNKKISIDEILCIDIERAETIVKNTLKLLKIQPNIFNIIEFIRMSPDYATCDEKMLAVYTATIGKVIDACKEEK